MLALMLAQQEIEQKASDLQQLLDRSVMVQETERKRIAQEIHDGITQMLVGALYEMQAAKQMLAAGGDPRAAAQKLSEALALISETVSEIRRVILDLHPTILDELGLVPALQRLARSFENDTLRCVLQVEGAQARLSSTQELALYRIAQEALNNIRRHAGASQALLNLSFAREHTTLTVRDDGRGIPGGSATRSGSPRPDLPMGGFAGVAGAKEHLGLIGMKERAQSVGGRFELRSKPEGGTSIIVVLPRLASHGRPAGCRAASDHRSNPLRLPMPPIKVLIVDDHPVVRRGLHSILGDAKDLQVVGEASNGSEALKQVGALKPDVVLMDIRLPGADGVQITRRVRREYPEAKIIILTTYDDDQHLYNAIEAGAHGFLTKHADYSDLAESIRAVARGERLLSPALVGKVLDRFQHLARAQALQQSGLTEQEIELLRLIAQGETNKEIGDKLFWSEVTVKRRASEVYSKLNVADRAQAVGEAMRRGLI